MSVAHLEETLLVVERLYLLTKLMGLHGAVHPAVDASLVELQDSVAAANPPFQLQFVGGVLFRDRALAAMTPDRFDQVEMLARLLHQLQADELTFAHAPKVEALRELVNSLADAQVSPLATLDGPLDGMQWREMEGARLQERAENVPPEVDAIAQFAVAMQHAEVLFDDAGDAWNWREGLSIVRRLERALRSDVDATLQAAEFVGDEGFGPARRALSAATLAFVVCRQADVSSTFARSVAHCVLMLAHSGYTPTGGLDPSAAAARALQRVEAAGFAQRRSGVEPHRLKVFTLLTDLTGPLDLALARLAHFAYRFEMHRCAADGLVLSRVDLMAYMSRTCDADADKRLLRRMVQAVGVLPVGTRVRLRDSRFGVVVSTPSKGADPWRPTVLVDGIVVQPEHRVSLQ